jgi:hypothetical protein
MTSSQASDVDARLDYNGNSCVCFGVVHFAPARMGWCGRPGPRPSRIGTMSWLLDTVTTHVARSAGRLWPWAPTATMWVIREADREVLAVITDGLQVTQVVEQWPSSALPTAGPCRTGRRARRGVGAVARMARWRGRGTRCPRARTGESARGCPRCGPVSVRRRGGRVNHAGGVGCGRGDEDEHLVTAAAMAWTVARSSEVV